MKDIIILTDKPITYDSCSKIIKDSFKTLNLLNDDSETLYMRKAKSGFEMWFSPDDVLDDSNNLMEDTIEKCPNKKAYLTNLSYSSNNISAKVIGLLMPLYGNMWIQEESDEDWFGTAEEYLERTKS